MSMLVIFNLLMAIICVLALCQTTGDRGVIALVFAIACISHGMFCADFEGFWYFFSAGVFALAVVSMLCAYGAKTRLTDDLINICALSIILNAYGFVLWFKEQPILSYQLAMVALYFIAILSLLRKDCADGHQPYMWHNSIRLFIHKGVSVCHRTKKEAGT